MTRAAIYARVSTEKQASKGYSIDAQLRKLRKFCKSKCWEISGEYIDGGYSGRTERRPGYVEMMASSEKWDVLVATKIDRVHRNALNFYRMCKNIRDSDKGVVFIEDGYDFTTAWGRFAIDILARVAQLESERTGERVRISMERARKRGVWTSRAAYGYRLNQRGELSVVETEAEAVRLCARLRTEGRTWAETAAEMNRRGIPWKNGEQWTECRARNLRKIPTYIGYRRNNLGEWTRGQWPPILDMETWNMIGGESPPEAAGQPSGDALGTCGDVPPDPLRGVPAGERMTKLGPGDGKKGPQTRAAPKVFP